MVREQARTINRDILQKMLIFWLSGFGILSILYQIKSKEASFIQRSKDLNSDMHSQIYEENCKGVSETSQEESSATLYTKMITSWSSCFSVVIFLYQIKAKKASFIRSFTVRNSVMQTLRYEENRKGVGKNNQARRCTKNAHFRVIWFQNSTFFISNQN